MYVKIINNKPLKCSVDDLKKEFDDTEIFETAELAKSKKPSEKLLSQFNIYPLITTDYPDIQWKVTEEGEPELREDGKWYQTWNVRKFNLSEKKRIFVTKDILMKRFHLCNTCEKYNKKIKICRECLCFMPFKRKFVSTDCPLEKW